MSKRNKKRSDITQEITYGLVANAGRPGEDPSLTMRHAVDCTQKWLSDRFPLEVPDESKDYGSYLKDESGQRLEVISLLDEGLWALRWTHPDTGMGEEVPPVPGRSWTTDVSFKIQDTNVVSALRVSCSTPEEFDAPVSYVRPKLARLLAQRVGLWDIRTLSEQPWKIIQDEDVEALYDLITSPDRRLPLIMISEVNFKRNWPYGGRPKKFILDGYKMTRDALGYAHVATVSFSKGFDWTKKVGHAWAAFDGAVRVYMPGLNFENDTEKKHPIAYPDQIMDFPYGDRKGPGAFSAFLKNHLHSFGAHRPFRWERAAFVPEARVALADARARQISELNNVEEVKDLYEQQVSALRQQLEESHHESELWSDLAYHAEQERDRFRDENHALRRQIDGLRHQLEAKMGSNPDTELSIPDNYEVMPDWVRENLSSRLVLHPRVVNNLKSAIYEDIELVYNALLLLANEYRNHRKGGMTFNDFCHKAKEKLGLDCSGSIIKERAKEFGDAYFVTHPIGTSKKEFLSSHLRKGSTKDDRLCLGIYFFWDEDTSQVVVGWLPSHLKNRMT